MERLPIWLRYLEKALGVREGPYVAGAAGPTYADFAVLHAFDAAWAQFPSACERLSPGLPRLVTHHGLMCDRPGLKAYLGSGRRRPWSGDSLM